LQTKLPSWGGPAYVRLDRKPQYQKYETAEDFSRGYCELIGGKDIAIVSTSNMVDMAVDISEELGRKAKIGVIDLFQLKPLNPEIIETLSSYKRIVSLEEHLLAGGIGSILSELITDNNLKLRLKRIGVDDKYNYEYGGRENIQEQMGIGKEAVKREIIKLI